MNFVPLTRIEILMKNVVPVGNPQKSNYPKLSHYIQNAYILILSKIQCMVRVQDIFPFTEQLTTNLLLQSLNYG